MNFVKVRKFVLDKTKTYIMIRRGSHVTSLQHVSNYHTQTIYVRLDCDFSMVYVLGCHVSSACMNTNNVKVGSKLTVASINKNIKAYIVRMFNYEPLYIREIYRLSSHCSTYALSDGAASFFF
jgi:hypothetical protein